MTYHSSITTRYGETYTAADHNLNVIANNTNGISLSTIGGTQHLFNVTSAAVWDPANDGVSATDLICFDSTLNFTGPNSALNGPASSSTTGRYMFFVNCVFNFEEASGVANAARTPILSGRNFDYLTTGLQSVPVNRGTPGPNMSFYNCKFNIGCGSAGSAAWIFGDLHDCEIISTNPSASTLRLYLQPGSCITNTTIDFSTLDQDSFATNNDGSALRIGGNPLEIEGFNIINQYLYVQDQTIAGVRLPFLGVEQNRLFRVSPDTASPNGMIFRVDARSPSDTTVILPAPRLDPRPNGRITWQRWASGTGTKFINALRYEQTWYADIGLTVPRADVKDIMISDVSYGTPGVANTIVASPSRTIQVFNSNTNGKPVGGFDFDTGMTGTAIERQFMDIPVSYLVGAGTQLTSESELRTSHVGMSLWGRTYLEREYDLNSWAADQAAADAQGGHWLPHYTAGIHDVTSDLMAGYGENQATLDAVFDAPTGSLSLKDISAGFKKYVWVNNETNNWGNSAEGTDGVDISGFGRNTIVLQGDATQTTADNAGQGVIFNAPVTNGAIQVTTTETDATASLTVNEFACLGPNRIQFEGGTLRGHLVDCLETFATPAIGDQYSMRNMTFSGQMSFNAATDVYVRLDNVNIPNGETLLIQNSGAGTVYVTHSGNGTPSVGANVDLVRTNVINVMLDGEEFDASKLTFLFSGSDSATPRTFSDIASDAVSAAPGPGMFTLSIRTPVTDMFTWYALAYDGYDIEVATQSAAQETVLVLSRAGQSLIDYSITDFNMGTLDLTQTNVTPIASAVDPIAIEVTDVDGTVIGDALTRIWLRKYVMETPMMLEAMARGYVPADLFRFDTQAIVMPASVVSRVSFTHIASFKLYQSVSRLVDSNGTDRFESQTVSAVNRRFVFAQSRDSISAGEVQEIVDTQTGTLVGATSRTLDDVYREAQQASNLALI